MKFIKILRLIAIFFLITSISLEAQKTKKGKPKPKKTPVREKTQALPQNEKEKDDLRISVKKEEPEPIEEKLAQKEKEVEPATREEEPKSSPAAKVDSSTPTAATPSTGETVNPITLNQYYSNDIWFRGFSVLGDRLAQRDNRQFQSMQHAWNLVTGVSYNVTENFSIGMNVYSPTAHRANRDNDYFMQSAPGNANDFTQKYLQAAGSGDPNVLTSEAIKKGIDPTSIQMRKEKNGLKDIFDASFTYKYSTKFGKVVTGFYFANNDNFNITLGELVAGLEFPFLKFLNPAYTSYYRFTSEGGGGGNGTSNHRLSISHKFFPENTINVTANLSSGYQYHSNLTEYRSGVSDISPKIQVNYGSFYVSFMDMIRPDSSLWDAPGSFGSATYKDSNRRDGMVNDPSKVHGAQNQFVVDQINRGADNLHAANAAADPTGYGREALKVHFTQSYQQQKFVTHIYHFALGYSMKF